MAEDGLSCVSCQAGRGCVLCVAAMTVFILFAASARAGVVAPHRLLCTERFTLLFLARVVLCCGLLVRVVQLFALLAVAWCLLARSGVYRHWWRNGSSCLCRVRCGRSLCRAWRDRSLLARRDGGLVGHRGALHVLWGNLHRYLSAHQDGDGLAIDFVHHSIEEVD